ncbi:MAG: hypothetical protein GWO11_01315, partial [Desulfuromonadales bacterium]|nr:hypothetical protein [Desulfuromonadales bacterium]NIR33141.1 hypothetical protein [Desulfuromonadales bacterium]NIS43143.1 hypothetical protein [Desulfuromonadales bacterium]
PLEWYLDAPGRAAANRIYQTEGLDLLVKAARLCLDKAQSAASSIDHVIFVSTTGMAAPSLDAQLIAKLGLRRGVSRLPVWGLGCAGGAASLARAADYCRAYPRKRVLVAALECCSLTFLETDRSRKNVVASAIFADGAAAVIVDGADTDSSGPRMTAGGSHLFADSDRIMGWDIVDEGMQLVLSPRLPAIVKAELPGLVDSFLAKQGLTRDDLTGYITHPGGARVIDAYRQGLDLPPESLVLTEEHLRRYGNLSSVSVLMVLEEWLETRWIPGRGRGLLSAFGPGFSAEMTLVEG